MNSSKSPVILIVEDDPLGLALLSDFLEDLKYKTIGCRKLDQAKKILDIRADISLLITDLKLQNRARAGAELVEYLRRSRPELPVIISSGDLTHAPDRVGRSNLRSFQKPYDLDRLGEAVVDLLGS